MAGGTANEFLQGRLVQAVIFAKFWERFGLDYVMKQAMDPDAIETAPGNGGQLAVIINCRRRIGFIGKVVCIRSL